MSQCALLLGACPVFTSGILGYALAANASWAAGPDFAGQHGQRQERRGWDERSHAVQKAGQTPSHALRTAAFCLEVGHGKPCRLFWLVELCGSPQTHGLGKLASKPRSGACTEPCMVDHRLP